MSTNRLMPSSRKALSLVFAAVFAAPGPGTPQERPPNPVQSALASIRRTFGEKRFMDAGLDPDTIVITRFNNNLTYIPSEYRVKANVDTPISWSSFDGPFTITALGNSPFEKVQFHSAPKTIGPPPLLVVHVAVATVQKTALRGTYHYAVGLYTNNTVYIDPSCPPIIIE